MQKAKTYYEIQSVHDLPIYEISIVSWTVPVEIFVLEIIGVYSAQKTKLGIKLSSYTALSILISVFVYY